MPKPALEETTENDREFHILSLILQQLTVNLSALAHMWSQTLGSRFASLLAFPSCLRQPDTRCTADFKYAMRRVDGSTVKHQRT